VLQRKWPFNRAASLAAEGDEERLERSILQRRAVSQAAPTTVPSIVQEVLRSPGQPLDARTRAYMESRFGHDFSQVRVHTDARAAQSAQSIDALAYTVGRSVVFGAGQYVPQAREGRRLLAHELTHVVQQGGQPEGSRMAVHPVREQVVASEAQADSVAAHVLDAAPGSMPVRITRVNLPLQKADEEERPGRTRGRRAARRDAGQQPCRRHSIPESGSGPRAAGRYQIRICVNTNELFVEELANPQRRVFHAMVVTGGEGTPTPKGRFRLGPWERDYTTPKWGSMSCTPWSKRPGFNVFGPYIARIHKGYFLHGTLFPGVLSMPWINIAAVFGGSHGCVRMNNVDLMSLHDGILSNPKGTSVVIEDCTGPAEASSELRLTVPFAELTTSEGGLGFEAQYRRFLPTLLGRRAQPYVGGLLGTQGLGIQAGLAVEPFMGLGLYLEGRGALRTEWFQRVEAGGGAEVGLALSKARSLRLGISWDVWQSLTDDRRRHILSAALGFRF
jgi:hypothetical protein